MPDQGVLAFGDSITNGGGELQWGVALQSWAQWVARALGMPFTNYAVDGAGARDVTELQIPAHQHINAAADPRYQLGCLYIGVNDVRTPDWDPVAYERDFSAALDYLQDICERVITVLIPVDLGRPPAGTSVAQANAVISTEASSRGLLLLDLRGFSGREVLMADHVHPTAMGQIAIAEAALNVLAVAGLPQRAAPRTLARPSDGLRRRARATISYAWRSLKRDFWIRVRQLR